MNSQSLLEADLKGARESYRRRAWSEAHQLLALADRTVSLGAEDLERAATAAYLIGRTLDFRRFSERAYHARLQGGDERHAARSAFWLGLTLLVDGEAGQANGWLARARRTIADDACVEQGYLLLAVAEQRLRERDADAALAAARDAEKTGQHFGDLDVTACARHLQGRALIQQRRVQAGLGLLDEAMIPVTRGELSPIVTGLIYCSVIATCRDVFAIGRAREWTLVWTRWCEQQPEMVAFTGICLVHRAEVLKFSGLWSEAMAMACRAQERPSAPDAEGPKPPATAFYQQGEIHRLRGEFPAAEAAYRQASRLGLEPHPGLALLRMAQGRSDAGWVAIRRILRAATDPLHRASLLPAYVELAVSVGELQEARAASAELDKIARRYATGVLRALAAHARGAVALAHGRTHAALRALRHAFELWQDSEMPYETARARVLIGLSCHELGDAESADLAFDAANERFKELGAMPDLRHIEALRKRTGHVNQQGLTARELQVLRHIVTGKTNRAIASDLGLSERTVDRHVSNILNKLSVPSRAAATAFAYSHKLL